MLSINNCQIQIEGGLITLPNITLEKGELLVITGPSGMGKSTFLHWLLGDSIRHANISGEIMLNGVPLSGVNIEQRRIGLLMQDVHLFPHLNAVSYTHLTLPTSDLV